MLKFAIIFILLNLISNCSNPIKSFKNVTGSFYSLHPMKKDYENRNGLAVIYGTLYSAESKEILIVATVKAISDTIYKVNTDFKGNYKLLLPAGSSIFIFHMWAFIVQ